jgi:lysophospholipase L1-like esterase
MRHSLRHVAVILALALLTASCTKSSDSEGNPTSIPSPSPHAVSSVGSYVALGDSFAAGPDISPVAAASAGCRRSKDNWPSLLADDLAAKTFTDVTCTGAPTSHLTAAFIPRGGTSTRPQLDAVDDRTQLITVTMGGNDGGTFPGILTACTDVLNKADNVCTDFVRDRLPGMLDEVKDGVERGLTDIRRKAPQAVVLMVGYFRVAPDKGGCAELGTTGSRTKLEARAEKRLDTTLASAAKAVGVGYLSLRKASKGHDACAGDEAWINGLTPQGGVGAPLHPNAAAMKAAAKAVAKRLREG